ncbi:MAG: ShlB/FhaC/HecB family hemolysin secretion/activation protein, partial [bacterium]
MDSSPHIVPKHPGIGFVLARRTVCFLTVACFALLSLHAAQISTESDADSPPPVPSVHQNPPGTPVVAVDRTQSIYIKEFRILGSHQLGRAEIEKAVYPYMGPERSPEDVEKAREALEKAFQDKGFQTVSVQIPQQTGKRGIVFLQVTEAKIGTLNVEGNRFYSLKAIKKGVPSLQPGVVPDFNKVSKEILALNQWSDRQVIPTLTPGYDPGTVNVNLKVKDTLPLHGSAEINNRYSYGTPEIRMNIAGSYDNLWQRGDSIGGSYQTAPQQPSAVQNWNIFNTTHVPSVDWLKLNLSYGYQNSISTLASSSGSSLGNGSTAGFRFLMALPGEKDFSQSLSTGIDFKHNDQITSLSQVSSGANVNTTALDYWPCRINYSGVWAPTNSVTIFDAGLSFGIRGAVVQLGPLGGFGNESEIASATAGADGGFFVVHGDLSHTHNLPWGCQIFGKIQGQYSPEPLIYTEQFSGGGLDTCRGYLEGTVVGDSAIFGSVELRSPSILSAKGGVNEWRVYGDEDIATTYNREDSDEPIKIHLNDQEREEATAKALVARLDAMQPGLREKIAAEKKAKLSDKQRQALDIPPEKRTGK